MGGFMLSSRLVAAYSAALLLAATMPQLAQARELVGFSDAYSSGTVVVKTSERALYYVLGSGKAVRYPVGVGRAGKQWTGTARISGKYLKPAWSPPDEVKRDKPSLPNVIPGGSSSNPMGAAAMTISGGGEYAIHGTNKPGSVGEALMGSTPRRRTRRALRLLSASLRLSADGCARIVQPVVTGWP
jgi:lipoprotein-anchoring transpeptidase ErfK/SrfK